MIAAGPSKINLMGDNQMPVTNCQHFLPPRSLIIFKWYTDGT
jgi:hypothetical protein